MTRPDRDAAGRGCAAHRRGSDGQPRRGGGAHAEERLAVIQTSQGEIAIEFFAGDAPNHVANFVGLAESGYYDGTLFHRIIPGFIIQGGDPNTRSGDPSTWGTGGPGQMVGAEFNSIKHARGIVSMARSDDPDSAGSQFFIMHADSNFLDGQYTAFGRVVTAGGLETLDRIAALETAVQDRPAEPWMAGLERITLVERSSVMGLLDLGEPDRDPSVVRVEPVGDGAFHGIRVKVPDGWTAKDASDLDEGLYAELRGPKTGLQEPIIRISAKSYDSIPEAKEDLIRQAKDAVSEEFEIKSEKDGYIHGFKSLEITGERNYGKLKAPTDAGTTHLISRITQTVIFGDDLGVDITYSNDIDSYGAQRPALDGLLDGMRIILMEGGSLKYGSRDLAFKVPVEWTFQEHEGWENAEAVITGPSICSDASYIVVFREGPGVALEDVPGLEIHSKREVGGPSGAVELRGVVDAGDGGSVVPAGFYALRMQAEGGQYVLAYLADPASLKAGRSDLGLVLGSLEVDGEPVFVAGGGMPERGPAGIDICYSGAHGRGGTSGFKAGEPVPLVAMFGNSGTSHREFVHETDIRKGGIHESITQTHSAGPLSTSMSVVTWTPDWPGLYEVTVRARPQAGSDIDLAEPAKYKIHVDGAWDARLSAPAAAEDPDDPGRWTIGGSITSGSADARDLVVFVSITDKDGYLAHAETVRVRVLPGGTEAWSLDWAPLLPGSYGVTVFALAGWDGTPEPVAAPRTGTVAIG